MPRGEVRVVEFGLRETADFAVNFRKDFLNSASAQRPFAKHKFLAGRGFHFHAGQSCAFLPSVVLFLHHEIELVETVHPRAVFFFVVAQRFEQPYHGHSAFVFERFHSLR